MDDPEHLTLSSWGLPEAILSRYKVKGINSLFEWQVECLSNEAVLNGKNLIYSAPTSAGKTLVAEILTIKTILEKNKKAIMILPFVSMVREKMYYFKDIFSNTGFVVEGLMGNQSLYNGIKSVDLAICTIEKANSLINKMLEVNSLEEIGTIIVDELHMLGESFRGYILELMLTKILYMCKKNKKIQIQLIGMSATLPNLDLLAKWLNADLYKTDFRPVPLKEHMKCGSTVYDNQLEKLFDIIHDIPIKDDNDQVVYLCLDTILNGHSILIFCPTKNWCEKLGKHIAQELCKIGYSKTEKGNLLRSQLKSDAIGEVLEQLKMCPVGLDSTLQQTVSFGVGFHHAGLTIDERDILEGAFRHGALRVLVATSTLSSGVNLPARRVIIRTPLFHGRPLDIHTYRQMIGRAGRKGHDTYGESFLLCTSLERSIGEQIMISELRPVESSLLQGELADSLKRAILEIVASGIATTPDDVELYTKCTLVACSEGNLTNPVTECINYLEKNELIRLQKDSDSEDIHYVATALGLACLSASLPPVEGLKLFKDLQRARQCFVLENDLHIIFLVTPLSVSAQLGHIDFLTALSLWEQLPGSMKRVGELIGVSERFIISNVRSKSLKKNEIYIQQMDTLQRFYTAMALHELVNEVPLSNVSEKYNINRGMLQALQQTAATFAGMVTAFCKRLGWSSIELLVSQFHDRLQFGIQRELCDLMRLDQLNGPRARALFNASFTSIPLLAAADWREVENALQNAMPFQTEKKMIGENDYETNKRLKLKNIWITGKDGLTLKDAAFSLIEEARFIIQKELGTKIDWDKQKDEKLNSSKLNQSSKEKELNVTKDTICPRFDAALRNESLNKTEVNPNLTTDTSKATIRQSFDAAIGNESLTKTEVNSNEKDTNLTKDTFKETNCQRFNAVIENETGINSNEMDKNLTKDSSKETTFQSLDVVLGSDLSLNLIDNNNELDVGNNSVQIQNQSVHLINNNNGCETADGSEESFFFEPSIVHDESLFYQSTEEITKTHTTLTSDNYSKSSLSHISNEITRPISDQMSENLSENHSMVIEKKLDLSHQKEFDSKISNGFENEELSGILISKVKTSTEEEMNNKVKTSIGIGNSKNVSDFQNSDNLDSFDLGIIDNLTGILEKEQKSNIMKHLSFSKKESSFNQNNCSQFLDESVLHELIDIKEEQIRNNTQRRQKRNSTFRINSEFGLDSQFEVTQIKSEDESIEMINEIHENNSSDDESASLMNESSSAFEANIFSFCENILTEDESKIESSTPLGTSKNESNSVYLDSQETGTPIGYIKACRNSLLNSLERSSGENLSKSVGLNESDEVFESSYDSNLEKTAASKFRFNSYTSSIKINDLKNDSNNKTNTPDTNQSPILFENSFEKSSNIVNNESNKTNENSKMDNLKNNSPISSLGKVRKTQVRKIFSNLHTKININKSLIRAVKRKNDNSFSSEPKKIKFEHSISDSVLQKAFETVRNWDNNDQSNLKIENSLEKIIEENQSTKENLNCNHKENVIKKSSKLKNKSIEINKLEKSDRILRSDDNKPSKKQTKPTATVKDDVNLEIFDRNFTSFKLENQLNESSKNSTLKKIKNVENISTLIAPNSSSNSSTNNQLFWKEIEIIDVCKNEMLSDQFLIDLKKESWISFTFDTEIIDSLPKRSNIGSKIIKNKETPSKKIFSHGNIKINGVAISIDEKRSFYISLDKDNISIDKRIQIIKEICSLKKNIILWDAKENFCKVKQCLRFEIIGDIWDPLIAEWILNPEAGQMDYLLLVSRECPEAASSVPLLRLKSLSSQVRVCIEGACTWLLMQRLRKRIQAVNLEKHFIEVEMRAIKCLARMELNGILFSKDEANKIKLLMDKELEKLEKKAYSLAGHKFSLSSTQQVAQVLFKELGLQAEKFTSKKTPSTSKEVLIKLKSHHELPEIILEWRKISFIITKVIAPLLKLSLEDNRIKGKFIYQTVSGRISMQEPNLQTIPRDFEISLQNINTTLSLRKAFLPKKEFKFISVDYCQLELRILAHFSQDEVLCSALNKENDVFKNIASAWHGIDINQVTDDMRQKSKQLCYGIIYGMGPNTLAEELKVSSEEAEKYIASFKQVYPGVQEFIQKTIDSCKEKGFIETLAGRRRFLPLIKSETKSLMFQAERQAVNSTIQGSAADIAKKGMIKVEEEIQKYQRSINKEVCNPLLHIHDELLFEIATESLHHVCKIIKRSCENAWKLSVKLPVKVKYGDNWGSLNEFIL